MTNNSRQTRMPRWLRHFHQIRRKWFNGPAFWLLIVLFAFSSAMTVSEPLLLRQASLPLQVATSTSQPALVVTAELPGTPEPDHVTNTPLPAELVANREQTFGIILGTVMLVMIVIIGTLSGIAARRKEVS